MPFDTEDVLSLDYIYIRFAGDGIGRRYNDVLFTENKNSIVIRKKNNGAYVYFRLEHVMYFEFKLSDDEKEKENAKD